MLYLDTSRAGIAPLVLDAALREPGEGAGAPQSRAASAR